MNTKERRQKIIKKWTEGVSCEECTPLLKLLENMTYEELVTPFVASDIRKGRSIQQCMDRYYVSFDFVRSIGRRIGVYTKRKQKRTTTLVGG